MTKRLKHFKLSHFKFSSNFKFQNSNSCAKHEISSFGGNLNSRSFSAPSLYSSELLRFL